MLDAGHPGKAKALGRQVRGFDEAVWVSKRYGIVVAGSVAKFGQNDDLRAFLVGTGKRVLVEASPLDRVWGIGLAADDERAHAPDRWKGLNLLGFALMEARETFGNPPADRVAGDHRLDAAPAAPHHRSADRPERVGPADGSGQGRLKG